MDDRDNRLERRLVAEGVASHVRHEMLNRLGSIRNAAFYIRRKIQGTPAWESDPRISVFFDLIGEEIDRATNELELLKISDIPQLDEVALEPLVEELDAALPEGQTLAVGALGTVRAHEPSLRAALAELVANAAEASPSSATIEVRAVRHGDCTDITVIDAGQGLESTPVPLRSTKSGHTGLGLFVARRAAALCGGELRFARENGRTMVSIRVASEVDQA